MFIERLNTEPNLDTFDHGIYSLEHFGRKIILVSSDNFELVLSGICYVLKTYPHAVILTPELITAVDGETSSFEQAPIRLRNQQVLSLSKNYPNATILLGTTLTCFESHLPVNCVAVIKAGEIERAIPKSYPTADELADFHQVPFQDNCLFPGTNVLVCRDLAIETTDMSYKIKVHGEDQRIKPLLGSDTHTVLLLSCWGAGASQRQDWLARKREVLNGSMTLQARMNQSFEGTLKFAINNLFHMYPNLQTIISCDRAYVGVPTDGTIYANRAFNGVFRRNDE